MKDSGCAETAVAIIIIACNDKGIARNERQPTRRSTDYKQRTNYAGSLTSRSSTPRTYGLRCIKLLVERVVAGVDAADEGLVGAPQHSREAPQHQIRQRRQLVTI